MKKLEDLEKEYDKSMRWMVIGGILMAIGALMQIIGALMRGSIL